MWRAYSCVYRRVLSDAFADPARFRSNQNSPPLRTETSEDISFGCSSILARETGWRVITPGVAAGIGDAV